MNHHVWAWESLMLISAVVLNSEKGGQGILAAFVVFNLIAGCALVLGTP